MADVPLARVWLNVPQDRLKRERLISITQHDMWDMSVSTNVYREPVYDSIIGVPTCLHEDWDTTSAGRYARIGLAGFETSVGAALGAKWEETNDKFAGDLWLSTGDGAGAMRTVDSFGKNVGIYFAWFSFGTGTEKNYPIVIGWRGVADDPTAVLVKLYFDGRCEILRGGVVEGVYSFNAGAPRRNKNIPGAGGNQQNTFHEVVLIPWRKRELLVIDASGGHFSHTFEGLNEESVNPTITPAGKFIVVHPDVSAKMQMAPVRYLPNGYAVSVPSAWRNAPDVGELWYHVDHADAYDGTSVLGAVVEVGNPTLGFVADGVATRFRTAAELNTTEYYTPNVYGIIANYFPVIESTSDESVEVTSLIDEMSMDIPESPSGAQLNIAFRNAVAIDDAIVGVSGAGSYTLSNGSNRTIQLVTDYAASVTALFGTMVPPSINYGLHDEVDFVHAEARDWYRQMEGYQFSDPFPMDGMTFTNALKALAKASGIDDAQLDIQTNSLKLEGSSSEWKYLIQAGDTSLDWWNRLLDDIAGNWIHGVIPTASGPVLRAGDATYWGITPLTTLYENMADAVTAGHASTNDMDADAPWRHTYTDFSEKALEPVANEVWITGWDVRKQRPFQTFKRDYASQDPSTAVNARPTNWVGEIRKFGLIDPAITTASVAERVCLSIFGRITPTRVVAQWTCVLPVVAGVPLWRGNVIALDGRGDYRINSMRLNWVSNRAGMPAICTATMTGSRELKMVGNTAGVTLKQIVSEHLKLIQFSTVRRSAGRVPHISSISSQKATEI